jgi:photosystem II stability/assembly factor-like uncharacterized protein
MHRTLAAAFISLLALGCALPSATAEPVWKWLTLPDQAKQKDLRSVFFLDAKLGWIVGDGGLCLATADGGTTWAVLPTGSQATLRDVRFTDAMHGWACGDGDPNAPEVRAGHVLIGAKIKNLSATLLVTEDGGKTWKTHWITTGFEVPSVEIAAAPVLQVGIGGRMGHMDGDIMRSSDNGATWRSARCYRALFDIRALDQKQWVAVGGPVSVGFFPQPSSPLYKEKSCRALFSKDGGRTWAPAKGSHGKGILRRAASKPGLPLLAVGDRGTILLSDDAGENWRATESPFKVELRGIAFGAGQSQLALAVGREGAVFLSLDRGRTWQWGPRVCAHLLSVTAAGDSFVAVSESGRACKAEEAKLRDAAAEKARPKQAAEKP